MEKARMVTGSRVGSLDMKIRDRGRASSRAAAVSITLMTVMMHRLFRSSPRSSARFPAP